MNPTDTADLDSPELRARAVAAARGDAPFDLLIAGGTVVDVVTGRCRAADIGCTGPLIASVHPAGSRTDAAETLSAAGAFVAPGLIDTHMHVESSLVTPAVYAGAVVPRGTTTSVWDPHEFGNVCGVDGVRWAVDAAAGLPLRLLVLAPSCVPAAPGLERAGADFDAETIAEILAMPGIVGLAEVMNMRGVIDNDARMRAIVDTALASGKLVRGHARGLSGAGLQAFAAAGVGSDHELVSGEDLLAKLEAGFTIELRGSHRHLLPEFAQTLAALGHIPQTVTLCTDDVFPDDLARRGGVDEVLRELVRAGLPAEAVLRAATLNAAYAIGRPDLGLLAPGRRADIAVFEDLATFTARAVVANGRLVAAEGALVAPIPENDAGPLTGTMHLAPLAEAAFTIPADGPRAEIATIDSPRFTKWGRREAAVEGGRIVPPEGTALIAVAHRHGLADGTPRVGVLDGWGVWRGAFATTVSHDSHNLTVFGGNPRDMAAAANAVIEAGGGMAVAAGGVVTAVLPLPLGGLVSPAPLAEVAAGFRAVREAADAVADWEPPYRVFKACFGATLACNAGPHQTDLGIADVETGKVLESPVLATYPHAA